MRPHSMPPLSNNGPSHSPGSVVWFISFGDLLTLLLCFFLVLTPWDQLTRSPADKGSQGVTSQTRLERTACTSLAHQPPREKPELLAEVPFYSGLVASQDGVAEAKLLAALEDGLRPHLGTPGLTMKVVLCPGAAGQRGSLLGKVLPLVASPGFSQAALEVEVAAACDEGAAPNGGEGVAVGSVKVSRL